MKSCRFRWHYIVCVKQLVRGIGGVPIAPFYVTETGFHRIN